MTRPLTKKNREGALYARPPAVEAQIDEVVGLPHSDLRARLLIADRDASDYLRSECLVHLAREGRRSDDQQLMNDVLRVLLSRCEANLSHRVPDCRMPHAADLRQEILDNLVDLFAIDGTDDSHNSLDFYECRFNSAFKTLRLNAINRDDRRQENSITEIELSLLKSAEKETDEETFSRVSDAFKIPPTQEWIVLGEQIGMAIEALPAEERAAVVLVHCLGYKIESVDPKEETAATRCNCTGRTIRNRLNRAAAKLSHFKEDL